jgi:DnaJ-class molecular chaperone
MQPKITISEFENLLESVLNLPRNCRSLDEMKKAYTRKMLETHPDKLHDSDANEKVNSMFHRLRNRWNVVNRTDFVF